MLRRRADVAVRAPDGSLQLEVEVKTRRGASVEWAARLLRNMIFHEAAPTAPYFMLATPDRLYLWVLSGLRASHASSWPGAEPMPDYEADASLAFGSYSEGGPSSLDNVGEDGVVLVVASWLTDLLNSDPQEQEIPLELRAMLFDSGLYDAAKRGAVATEAALS